MQPNRYHPCIPLAFHLSILPSNREKLPDNRRKNHRTGIRAAHPFAILHADITLFETNDKTKGHFYFIQDNFSRTIISYTLSKERKAKTTVSLIKEALNQAGQKANIDPVCVIAKSSRVDHLIPI